YYRDPELGLYFLGMAGNGTSPGGRFYDPAAGRFVTQDPIGFKAEDNNFYRYVGNNPVNEIDPSGLESKTLHSKSGTKNGKKGTYYWWEYHTWGWIWWGESTL